MAKPGLFSRIATAFRGDTEPTDVEVRDLANLDMRFWMPGMSGTSTVSSHEIQARPYQYHWLIYSAAHVIAKNVSTQCVKRLRKISDKTYVDDHPIARLLSKPNMHMTSTTFFEAIILQLLLSSQNKGNSQVRGQGGQSFLIGSKTNGDAVNLLKGEIPDFIFPYGEDYVSAVVKDNQFAGWKFEIPGVPNTARIYQPWEVIRIYNYNPYNILTAISPFSPAMTTLMQDINSEIWNSRIFDNDAVPAGVLSTEQKLTEQQAKQLLESWNARHGGPMNARGIAILYGGLKFQSIATTQKDMDWIKQKQRSDDIVTSAYGINKIARGNYEQINYATIVEGRRMLWEDTYLPVDNKILEAINSSWVQYVDADLRLTSDLSNIRVLQDDPTSKAVAVKTYYDAGIPTAVGCRICKVSLTEEDIKQYPWLSEQPVAASAGFGAAALAPAQPAKTESVKRAIGGINRAYNREEIRRISDSYIQRVLEPGEQTMLRMLVRYFTDQRNAMQDKVDAWLHKQTTSKSKADPEGSVGVYENPDVDDILLDIDDETRKLMKGLFPIIRDQMKREAAKVIEEVPSAVGWNVTDERVQHWIDERKTQLEDINNLTFEKVKTEVSDVISQAEAGNWTPSETAKAVKDALGDVGEYCKNHARTIARTETATVSAQTRNEMFIDAGIENIQWINANDELVRSDHQDEPVGDGGSVVAMGDVFSHTQLHYPCEPGGAPEQVIQCRCSVVSVEPEVAQGD
jgi:phage portal protein BeeE